MSAVPVRAYVAIDGSLMVSCGHRGDIEVRRAAPAECRESEDCPQAEGWITALVAESTLARACRAAGIPRSAVVEVR